MQMQKFHTRKHRQRIRRTSGRKPETVPLYHKHSANDATIAAPGRLLTRSISRLSAATLYPMDIFCLVYLAVIFLLLVFYHPHIAGWVNQAFSHAFFLLGIVGLIFLSQRFPALKWLNTIRSAYPVAVIAYGWGKITALVSLMYGSYWATEWVVLADKLVFQIYPTVWCEQFFRPWLDELMNVFYCGYYLFMPLSVTILLFKGMHQQLRFVLSLVTFTYLGNFILFYIFPVLGPQVTPEISALSSGTYSGYWIASLTKWIQSHGSVMGGAFPSSHVSGAVIWSLAILNIHRKTGIFMAFCVPGIAVSTVYLGYHHAMDPIAGILWGLLSYKLAQPVCEYLLHSNFLRCEQFFNYYRTNQ